MPKKRKKYWRDYVVNGMPPPMYELRERYSSLISKLVDIITGESLSPSSLHFWFYKRLSYQLFGQTVSWTPHTLTLSRELINNTPSLDKEEIEQQCWLFLIEIWAFYVDTYRHDKEHKFVFYDYARFHLVRYISDWVSKQILLSVGDVNSPVFSDEYWIEDPDLFKVNLGWIVLRSQDSRIKSLSVSQKYLLYLKHGKQLSVDEICSLTKRNKSAINEDLAHINKTIKGAMNEPSRN